MRLNQATDYAFRAVLYLCRLPAGEVVEAKTIAADERIPIRFLLKILRLLNQAGIVESLRGVSGGHKLAKKPREITMKDVVEAVEGPIEINSCLVHPEACNKKRAGICSLHQALFSVRQVLNQELASHDFETLSKN